MVSFRRGSDRRDQRGRRGVRSRTPRTVGRFYLLQPEKLIRQALVALLEAEDTDGKTNVVEVIW
jgi:hypothetical protein